MSAEKLDEEGRGLLRQIVEAQGYRQLMAGNIRGYGIQFLPELEDKLRFTRELEHTLIIMRDLERIYRDLDGGNLDEAARPRLDRIPYPETRLELAACLALTGRAERAVAGSYLDSSYRDLAAVARTLTEAEHVVAEAEERLFVEYCAEPGHRPQAQQYWNRWFTLCLLSLGRPGTARDQRAMELGLRSKRVDEVVHLFFEDAETLRLSCSLEPPLIDKLGVELPEDLQGRVASHELQA